MWQSPHVSKVIVARCRTGARRAPSCRLALRSAGERLITGIVAVTLLVVAGCAPVASEDTDPYVVGILQVVADVDNHEVFLEELRRSGLYPSRDVRVLPEDPGEMHDADQARVTLRAWQTEEDLDLIIAFSTPVATIVAEDAPDVPTLVVLNDPVAAGLVVDPSQPEGSMTGVTFRTPADRTLDLASDLLGGVNRIGLLVPTDDPAVPAYRAQVAAAARGLGIETVAASFGQPEQVGDAVDQLVEAEVDAVFLFRATRTFEALPEIEQQLTRVGLPAVSNTGLMDFAVLVLEPDLAEMRRQLARQAARLLRGSSVSSTPVEDPRRFVTIINASQVEALGLPDIDGKLLRRADVVR
jgi:putative tryptophan/tyrosine transport system substrate-binding protein